MFRIICWIVALAAFSASIVVGTLVVTQEVNFQDLSSATRQEQLIDALRPWVAHLDALGNHSLLRVGMAAFFFLMILTISTKD